MTLKQFLTILNARWRVILALWALVVITAAVTTFAMPKSYTAVAAVVLDVKSPDPIAGMILPGMTQPGYMATQLDLLRTERVARGVIQRLRLTESAELREQWQEQTGGVGSIEAWLSDVLLANLDARPSRESNVISISYRGRDPAFAAAMANAFVDSYIKTTLELRVEPAKQYSSLFDDQALQARNKLEAAQARLSKYQQDNGLLATDERMDIENARLSELSSQLVAFQALATESGARQTQSDNNPDRVKEVLDSPVIAALTAELARQEARLRELQSRFGSAHPAVQELQANVNELSNKISSETGKVTASVGLNNQVNRIREGQVRHALQAQRVKVLRLKELRDEAGVLIKDVTAAQQAYDLIVTRRNQTALESQSTQTNVSVVKNATAPFSASSPKTMVNLALAMAVGLVFALGTVTLIELWDRRLRSDDDINLQLGVPVLGSIMRAPCAPPAVALSGPLSSILKLGYDRPGSLLRAPSA